MTCAIASQSSLNMSIINGDVRVKHVPLLSLLEELHGRDFLMYIYAQESVLLII